MAIGCAVCTSTLASALSVGLQVPNHSKYVVKPFPANMKYQIGVPKNREPGQKEPKRLFGHGVLTIAEESARAAAWGQTIVLVSLLTPRPVKVNQQSGSTDLLLVIDHFLLAI